ncbi:MAG: hypothetical protein AABY00_04130 [Nanoarchaeota archaeon]
MNTFQKKISATLLDSEQQIRSAERFVNVLYPQLEDSRILLRALEQLWKAEVMLISTTLQLEYVKKRVRISLDPLRNRTLFFKVCVKRYNLSSLHKQVLQHLLLVGENYTKSGCTFPQRGKAIILNDDGTLNEITSKTVLDGISSVRALLKNLEIGFLETRKL